MKLIEGQIQMFARAIQAVGGRAMLVGGCVRDEIMGIEPKDFDIEVYGVAPEKLREIMAEFGKVDAVGESFQVYKIGQDIDVSLPRRERKTGVGHKGFTVEGDPDMSFEEACSRRDFGVNAIMKDPLTGEIVDPYNGRQDIIDGVLTAISTKTFQEDSLRVLRLAQFASRFGFAITSGTAKLAKETDLYDLPQERIWMELEKMFLKSPDISVGVEYLFELGIAEKLFPSLRRVDKYSLQLVSKFITDLSDGEKLSVILTVVARNCSYTLGDILGEFGVTSVDGYNVKATVEKLIIHAPIPATTNYQLYKMAQEVDMKLASRVFFALGIPAATDFEKSIKRLGIEDAPLQPLIQGRHLIELGLTPSPAFSKILGDAYEKQMRGEFTTLDEGLSTVKAML